MHKTRVYIVLLAVLAPFMGASIASAETVDGQPTVFGVADTTSLASLPLKHSATYGWTRAYRDLRALRAGVIRVPLSMGTTSLTRPVTVCDPADKGYDWTLPDLIVRQAQDTYARVMFDIDITPSWAGGDKSLPTAPVVADFACAAQKRYLGDYPDPLQAGKVLPKVSLWEVLNEPNMLSHYNPSPSRTVIPDRIAPWPALYAKLADAVAIKIHLVNPEAEVAAGALANAGNVAPLDFLEAMASAVPSPDFDAISVHPYPLDWVDDTPTWTTGQPTTGYVSFANLDQLREALASYWPNRHFNLWLTELAWQTNQIGSDEGVSLQQQANYLQQAFEIAAEPGSDIEFVCWFLMLSEPQLTGYSTGFQTGLSYMSGPKLNGKHVFRTPAFSAFQKWQNKK